MKKQSGNIIEWLILGVVLIGVIALIAWQYMNADKAQNAVDKAASQSNIVTPEDKVVLADWKVELKDVSSKYGTVTASKDEDAYVLTSSKLKQGTYTCQDADHKGTLGTLHRLDAADSTMDTVKVGDKYYGFVSALQNECYREAGLNTLGKDFATDLGKYLVESKS